MKLPKKRIVQKRKLAHCHAIKINNKIREARDNELD